MVKSLMIERGELAVGEDHDRRASRKAHATPLTTDAAPGPSVVRQAPVAPVTSACAIAAIAPAVSVDVSTKGNLALPAAAIKVELPPPPGDAEQRPDARTEQLSDNEVRDRHEATNVSRSLATICPCVQTSKPPAPR